MTESKDPARNARLEDLVSRALDLPVDQRDAFLKTECGDDAELLDEARSWLEGSVSADTGFLAPPQMARGAQDLGPQAAPQDGGHALVLGDYEVLEQIGEGGMARVYRARSQRTGQEAAIKVISAHAGLSNRHLERFHRESLNQGRLNHPGIVPVYADGQQDQWHWIAQELVDGHDLERELRLQRREPLPNDPPNLLPRPGHPERTSKVIEIIAQAAEALDHAHQHGVVHRDVKPSNLLLRPSGRVLLADFGLSRDEAMGSLTRTDEIAGSLYYMSPEQTRSLKDRVDHRTDIYSLGVVLYELLALRRPFEAGTSVELLKRISESTYRPLRSRVPDVPEPLEIIVDRALSRNPEQRFATMADFAEDLRRFQRGKPILSRKPTRAQRLREWTFRQRQWLPAAAALVVLTPLGVVGVRELERRQNLARVTILAPEQVEASSEGAWSGTALRLDPMTDRVLESRDFALKGSAQLRLQAGDYRFEVRAEGRLVSELRRTVSKASEIEFQAPARRDPADTTDMVFFEGGLLELDDGEDYRNVALQGETLAVAPFLLDRYEVTNAQYREFLEATGTPKPPFWDRVRSPEHDALPVVHVGWAHARSYAEWVGKRLPTFAEWTWAARGPELRRVPWTSDVPFDVRGNTTQTFELPPDITSGVEIIELFMSQYLQYAVAVDSMPEANSPEGIHHLLGNVFEWTETRVYRNYKQGSGEWEPWKNGRYALGGHWTALGPLELEKDLRNLFDPEDIGPDDIGHPFVGFRCARSAR